LPGSEKSPVSGSEAPILIGDLLAPELVPPPLSLLPQPTAAGANDCDQVCKRLL